MSSGCYNCTAESCQGRLDVGVFDADAELSSTGEANLLRLAMDARMLRCEPGLGSPRYYTVSVYRGLWS